MSTELTIRLALLAEPLVGISVLTSFGMVGGDFLVALADTAPAFRVERFNLEGDEIVLAARDGLDPEFDMLGGKVEVGVEKPDARGPVLTPGEDAALVATEKCAVNPTLVLESRADLLPGSHVP
jgi:hypothetical protein